MYFLPRYVERDGDELPLCGWNIYSCEVIKQLNPAFMFLEGPSLKATDRHFHLIFSIAHFGFAQGYETQRQSSGVMNKLQEGTATPRKQASSLTPLFRGDLTVLGKYGASPQICSGVPNKQ